MFVVALLLFSLFTAGELDSRRDEEHGFAVDLTPSGVGSRRLLQAASISRLSNSASVNPRLFVKGRDPLYQ